MLVTGPVDDGLKTFHAFRMKVAALFEEGYSLPLLVHESIVEDIQTRLDQWRAKLHNDNVISRISRTRRVKGHKDIKQLVATSNSQEVKVMKTKQKRRSKKQYSGVGKKNDNCETGLSMESDECHHCESTNSESVASESVSSDVKEATSKNNTRQCLRCETCEKVLKTERGLIEHQEMHKSGPVTCPECGKVLHSKSSIYIHKKMHKELLQCPHCSYTSGQRSWLKQHVIAVHNKEQKYLCDICAKAFCYESVLKRHIEALHSEGSWIKCELCDYSTKTRQCLKRHIVNKHTPTISKWMCDLCGNVFRSKAILEDHRHLHLGEKRFKCMKCNDTFACRSSKNRHLRTVHGEKHFSCSDCGKLFSERVYLRRHAVIHTGEKNFLCGFCDYCCNTRGNLRKHWRVVHKKKDHDVRQQRVTRLFSDDVDRIPKTIDITLNGITQDCPTSQAELNTTREQYSPGPSQVDRLGEQYCVTAPCEVHVESSLSQAFNSYTLATLSSGTMTTNTLQCSFSLLKPVTKVDEVIPSPVTDSTTEGSITKHHEQELAGMSPHIVTTVQHSDQGLQYATLENWSEV